MVQTSAYNPNEAAVDPYALLEGGGKAISFAFKDENGYTQHMPIGTQFTGIIKGDLRSSQVIDFETKQPKFYPDGKKVMQVIMDLQTDMRDDEFDDGVRALYVKNQMLAAFTEALKATRHLGRIGEGTRVTVTLVGSKPSNKGNPQKIYQVNIGPEFVAYVPPEARQAQDALYGGAPAQPVQGFPQQGQVSQYAPPAPQYGQPVPQQQYQQPAQPQFPGQVAPAPQQVAPPQPVQQVAPPQQYQQPVPQPVAPAPAPQPVQQVPQQAPQPSPALEALNALAAQPVAAASPQVAPAAPHGAAVTQADVDAFRTTAAAGIDPQTALAALAEKTGNGPEWVQALATAVGVQLQ